MVFAYYHRLSRKQQAVYRASDTVRQIRVPDARALTPLTERLAAVLESGDRRQTESASAVLLTALTERLAVAPVRVRVMAVRPSDDWGELHGFYVAGGGRRKPLITIWMRTARRQQTVAFRTFLRTLLHELCHHLDVTLLGLPDSLHTEAFYKRET